MIDLYHATPKELIAFIVTLRDEVADLTRRYDEETRQREAAQAVIREQARIIGELRSLDDG